MSGLACVFAGQGAQFVGMGKDLVEAFPACKALYDKADQTLGYALSKVCFEGPIEELTKSSVCQPAIFVTSIACFEAFRGTRAAPDFAAAAGLSLGEWSALHAAGVLSFEDTLRILEARGRFMQEACEARDGAMVSVIGLPRERLQPICSAAGVQMANLNSEEQTVLSGDRKGIEVAEKMAKEAGAKRTVALKVAGAFHSALMQPAAVRLEQFLVQVPFHTPRFPVLANATGRPHGDPQEIRRLMVLQVTTSVQWQACIEWLAANAVTQYVEFGPGNVLSGLIKRIDKGAVVTNIQDIQTLQRANQAV